MVCGKKKLAKLQKRYVEQEDFRFFSHATRGIFLGEFTYVGS